MKKHILFIALLVLINTLVACSNGGKREIQELSISFLDYDGALKNSVNKFNSDNRDIRVNADIYNLKNYEKYVQNLKQGLSTGTAPDIVVFDYGCSSKLNVREYMNGSVFADLNELFADGNGLKLSDYNETVLDAGIADKKRYLVPVSFYIRMFLSTQDILKKNRLDSYSEKWTWEDADRLARDYAGNNSGRKLFDSIDYGGFSDVLGISSADGSEGLQRNPEALRRSLEKYGEMTAFCSSPNGNETANDKKAKMLFDSEILMLDANTTFVKDLWTNCTSISKAAEPALLPYPSKDGITAYPDRLVGISANCKNKGAALRYVKMLLGEEVQKNGFMSLPVNRNAWGDREKTLPEHLWAELDRIITGISSARLEDTVASAIVKEEVGRFAGGELSLDQAVASITERIGALQIEADIENGNTLKANERNGAEAGQKTAEKKELKIYLMDNNKNAMNEVEEYNRVNDNSIILVTTFEDRDEYRKRLSTEILAGEGPDIVLFSDRDLPTIRKTINSGVFCDIEDFIRNDSEFDFSELNRKVFDCGVLNGKRYVVPLEYNLSTLYTTPGILESGKISLEGGDWSWDGIRSITNGYSDKEKSKYFLASLQLKEIIISSGLKLIDYEKKQVFFNSPDFVRFLKVYKEICSNCCMPEEIQERYGQDDISLMKNGKLSMGKDSNILNPENLLFTNSISLQYLGEELELFYMPSLNKDTAAAAYPSCLAGINSNSGSKEACFKFIKALLTGTYQKECNGIPVNNKVYNEQLDRFSGKEGVMDFTVSTVDTARQMKSSSLPGKLAKRARELVSDVKQCELADEAVFNMIRDEVSRYMEGKVTAEQAARNLNDKVSLYLNE